MTLIEETVVPDGALPVEEFKAHLRLGSGFAEDDVQNGVLKSFLRAALVAIEARTSKVLIVRSFALLVHRWSASDAQPLPVAPVSAVTQVEIEDRTGARTPLDPDSYWLEQDPARPQLRPVGVALPAIPTGGRAAISFEAGFGTDWHNLPADLRQAVMMLAAHYYEFRHDTGLGSGCMPFGVTSLIERFQVLRLGAGR